MTSRRRHWSAAVVSVSLLVLAGVTAMSGGRSGGDPGTSPGARRLAQGSSGSARPFPVLDATIYQAKPDLRSYGVTPMKGLYAGHGFWRKTGPGANDVDRSVPYEAAVRELGKALAREKVDLAFVDIEHWPLTGDDAAIAESIEKYRRVLEWLRAESPRTRLGYYGAPPIRNYWAPVKGRAQPGYSKWEMENRRLTPIAERSDVLFPSLYTFYEDQSGWVKYAEANLAEARKYGKPVYAFLWPQFHESNQKLQGQYLSSGFWRVQLETCYRQADGVVIWGGFKEKWDPGAAWWLETVRFLRERGLSGGPGKDAKSS